MYEFIFQALCSRNTFPKRAKIKDIEEWWKGWKEEEECGDNRERDEKNWRCASHRYKISGEVRIEIIIGKGKCQDP